MILLKFYIFLEKTEPFKNKGKHLAFKLWKKTNFVSGLTNSTLTVTVPWLSAKYSFIKIEMNVMKLFPVFQDKQPQVYISMGTL